MNDANTVLDAKLLHHILQHATEPLMVVSAIDLILLEANQRTCDILGQTRESLLGQALSNIECALQDVFFWEELKLNPEFCGTRVIESEWLSNQGEVIPIEKRVTSFSDQGQCFWIIQVEVLTEKRRMAQEQILLASQLQSSLEATAEGILSVDLQGRVINLNRRFAAMWDLSDELIVARDEAFMMDYVLSCLRHPEPFEATLQGIKNNPEADTENTLGTRDGRHIICVSKPEYLRDRLVGRVFSMRDISAMKKVENDLVDALNLAELAVQDKSHMVDALKISESRLRRLVNSSLIGIFQGDMSGHLTLANDVLLELLGVQHSNILDNQVEWLKLTSPEYHEAHQAALAEIREYGQAAPFEAELTRKDGSKVPVMVGLAQLEGSRFEWVGFVLDLTEQKKADRAKSEFISVVSHELRTPLTSIRGALGLLENGAAGELTPKVMHLIRIAHRNSQRLGNLVNDLLDMEKLVSGKMEFKSESFNLTQLALQAIEANAAYAAALGVQYRFSGDSEPLFALGDSERVMQVFANLLSNAAKFSPKGEVVVVSLLKHDAFIRVEVEDRGIGIPLEFRDRIFSKFAQADGSNTRQRGGTGLGLNIAKSFVEKMGGEINFQSEVNKGSLFWFTLPVVHNAELLIKNAGPRL